MFRKYLLFCLIIIGTLKEAKATHLMGGSLTYQYISYNSTTLKYKYRVKLKLYRDCNGTALYTSLEMGAYIQDNVNPNASKNLYNNVPYTIPLVSHSFIPLPGQTAGCTFAANVCVEEGIYQMDIDIPFNAGGYHLVVESCCRNNAINNLNNPGNQGQSYYAFIPPNYIVNSSPTFVDAPVPYICAGDTASLLNAVTDPDGDVLTYSFVNPYQGQSLGAGLPNPYAFPIPNVIYNTGYNENQPFGAGGYASINAANGLTQYMSPTQGFYVVAVEIKEFRNNQLIGKTRRDMQIVVLNCPANSSPLIAADPDSGYVVTNYNISAGSNLCFNVTSTDPTGDSLYLTHTGNIFNSAITNPPATMNNVSGVGSVTSNFCWNTSCSQAGTYIFYVKSTDNGCPAKTINQVYTINVSSFGPSAITGSNSVCANQIAAYSVPVASGVTYTWSVTGGTIISGSGTNSINIKWGTGTVGTVTISETNAANCVSTPVTLNVNIKPLPNANAGIDKTICNGSSVQIGNAAVAGVTYLWTPLTGLSNAGVSNPTSSASITTSYFMSATGPNGCSKSDTVLVTVNPLPLLTTNPAAPAVCTGGSVNITASGANTYLWTPSTGLNTTTGANVISTPTNPITYTITGTNTVTGCQNTATVSVVINSPPVVNATPNNSTVCAGTSVTLTASGANTYVWTPSAGLNTTSGSNVIASPAVTTSYIVTGTNTSTGCTDTAIATVNVNSLPVITIAPVSAAICVGASVTLTASGANTYVWSPSTGLNTTSGAVVTAAPAITTTYTSTGTNTLTGCIGTKTVVVTVNPLPALSVTPVNPDICLGSAVSMTASGANTYAWSPSTGLNTTSGASVTANPVTATTYTITGTNTTTGCVGTLNNTVTIKPLPNVSVAPAASTICAGTSTTLTANGANTYVWTPSAGLNTTTGATVIASPALTTTYTVTGTNTATGCSNSSSVTVTVNPLPDIIIAPAAPAICLGASVNLNATGADTYVWSPSTGLNTTSSAAVIASPVVTTTYTVTGTITATGCINNRSVTVTVNPLPGLSVTPNNPGICLETSVSMTASGANTYGWSPSVGLNVTTGSSVIANPLNTTTYTITGTNTATGCVNTLNTTVTVKALPVVSVAPPASTICAGASATLTATGADVYVWTPSTGLNVTTGSVVIASPIITTTYTVTGTNTTTTCSNDTTVIVTVNPLPVVIVAPSSATVCKGSSVNLTASGADTYSWTPSSGLSSTNGAIVTASPNSTITYIVTGTNTTTTCQDTQSVIITVNPLPNIDITPSAASVCLNDTARLIATGAGSYLWTPTTGLNISNNDTVFALPIVNTFYTVTGTDLNGCVSSDTITVFVKSLPLADAGSDTTMCYGQNYLIGMNDQLNTNYLWQPSVSLADSTASQTIATPPVTTTYILYVQNSFTACLNSDTVTVNINQLPVPDVGIDTWICPGRNIALLAHGGINYEWFPGSTLSDSTIANPVADPLAPTTYVVFVIDSNGCSNSDTILVDVSAIVPVNAGTDRGICIGTSTTLGSAPTAPPGTTFNWQPSTSLDDTSSANPIASPFILTTYIVYAANDTCRGRDTVTINVNLLPIANAGSDVAICYGANTTLNGSGGIIYSWQPPAGLSNAAISNPLANPLDTINYVLTVTDTNACSNTDTVTVTVNPLPVVDAGTNSIICLNQSATIGSVSNEIICSWSSNPPGFGFGSEITTVSPNGTTTYYLLGTDSLTGCVNSDSVKVTVNPLPNASVISDTAICFGNSIFIGDTSVAGSTYSWTSDPIGFASGSSNPAVNPVDTITYYLTETIILTGCQRVDSVHLEVNPLPLPFTGNDTALCFGSSVQLGTAIQSNYSYSWTSDPAGFTSLLSDPTIVPTATAVYTVLQTNTITGCYANDSVNIVVNPLPVPVAGNDTAVCFGAGLTIGIDSIAGHSYSWTSNPVGFTSNISEPFISPLVSTTYYLTQTISNTACAANDSIVVTVNPLPLVNAGNDTSICIGSAAIIGSSNDVTHVYSWTSNPSGYTSSIGINTVSPIQATTYYLTDSISATGCMASDSVHIIVNILPLAIVGNDTALCIGSSVSFGINSINDHTYNWSSNPVLVNDATSIVTYNPTVTTTYYLTETNSLTGCSSTDSANVVVNLIPNAPVASSNTPVCLGDTIRLFAAGPGTQYSWTGQNSFSSALQNPKIAPATLINAGQYFVTVTVAGCLSPADTVTVFVSQPAFANAGPDLFICEGIISAPMNGTITGGSNSGIWSSLGSGGFIPSDTLLINTYFLGIGDTLNSITIVLATTNNQNCPADYDTMIITIGTIPNVNAGSDMLVCANTPVINLSGNVFGGFGTGSWSTINGTGTFESFGSVLTNVYHASASDVANGSVTFVLHSTGACTEIYDTIVVYFELPPTAEFSSNTAPYNINETINFQNSSTGEITWQWNFGDDAGTSSSENPIYSYPENGTYPVTLIVTDEHNCVDTVVHNIEINVVALTLPTAFTPNGDGMNDVLFVKGGPFKNLELRIYNEWGNLIFMSNSQAIGWDGTYNGQDQPGGVYTYTVVATDNADRGYKLSGDVTLIK